MYLLKSVFSREQADRTEEKSWDKRNAFVTLLKTLSEKQANISNLLINAIDLNG
jgi:FixJ family two-component response regulator